MTDLFFIHSWVYDTELGCDVPVPGEHLGHVDENLPVGLLRLVLEPLPAHRSIACDREKQLYRSETLLHLIAGNPP